MAILTKNALSASNQASFPNNTTGAITPQILRDFNQDVIDTLVDSLNTGSYAITTGSNDFTQPNNFTSISASSFVSASEFVGDGSKLTNITASVAIPISDEGILQGYATQLNFSGSNISASLQAGIATISVNTNNLVTTSSFNSFSQSVDGRLDSLEAATSSYANSASVAAVDAAQQSQINSLIAATSSLALTSLNAFTASQETKDATLGLYTASVDEKFTNIGGQSGSWDNTSLNSFTASQNTKNSTLATYTASVDTKFTAVGVSTSSLNTFTGSQNTKNSTLATYTASVDTKFATLGTQSGSWITESESGSFLITASVNLNTITFTKGDNTTFAVTVNTGSAVTTDLTSLNAFTASQDTKNTTLANVTSSLNASTASQQSQIDNLIAATGSYITTPLTSLNSFTASQDTKNSTLATYTASVDTKFSTLGTQSGSWITESETASFARTNVDNNFSVNQTFTNITAVSASFQYVQTTYETSSVIYSSGSNQFGDELSDIQTLSGSVKVQGSLTVNGTPVQTSSVDITSLNAFTASQETKNSTLATYTASVDSQLSSLTNATASYAISSSVAAVDAAQQSQIDNLIAWTSSVVPTNISSLNAFTASQETKNSTLATYTASVDSSLTNINSFTASNGNTSLNAYTQSNDTKWSNLAGQTGSYVTSAITASSLVTASVNLNTITFTKGDASTFNITVDTGSAVTTDLTSLNAFTASQETKDTTLASVTSSLNSATASLFTSTSLSLVTASAVGNTITFTKGDTSTFAVSVSSTPIDTGSLLTTASFNAYTSSNDQRVSSLETNSASVNISIGNINTATASLFTSASLALVTASFAGNTLTFTKGDTSTFGVVIPDNSGSAGNTVIETVYTGENITKGDPLYISGSQGANPIVFKADAADPLKMPVVFVSNETIGAANTTSAITLGLIEGIDLTGYVAGQTIYVAEGGGWSANLPSGSNSITQLLGVVTKGGSGGKGLVLNPGPAQLPGLDTGKMWVGGSTNQPVEITSASFASSASFNSYTSSTDSRLTNIEATTASLNTSVAALNTFTASQDTKNSTLATYTGSIDTKFATLATQSGSWVTSAITASSVVTASVSLNTITFTKGDASTFALTVDTGSGGGGGAAFPFTGNAVITGSLGISGSMFGGVIALSVVSTTASVDFSAANIFTLTLPSASTRINPTNIRAGQTVNIQITQPTPGTGSVTFPSNVKFAGGNDYQATATGSAIDMLTLVSYDGTNVLATSIKNFL